MIPFFNLKSLNDRHRDELVEAATRVVDSGWYILGEEVKRFEASFAEYCGVKHAIGVGNGLNALSLIIRAYKELGVFKDGDEILVAANSYIATILSITENNLVPVLVEPNIETLNLDTSLLEENITSKTKGIMLLHLYGLINYDKTIETIAKKHNLKVIEDGAHAPGAKYRGRSVGSLGDACGISFYPTKPLSALGDAGIVTTDDNKLAMAVRALGNYGRDTMYTNKYKGTNSRLDEMQASLLMVKLKYLDEENNERREVALKYIEGIKNDKLILPSGKWGDSHVWHLFVIRTKDRDGLQEYLKENGIATLIHYPLPPHKQEAYKEWNDRTYPITEAIHETVLSLPLYPTISETDIEKIITACNLYGKTII